MLFSSSLAILVKMNRAERRQGRQTKCVSSDYLKKNYMQALPSDVICSLHGDTAA